jgi:hypothetical protein
MKFIVQYISSIVIFEMKIIVIAFNFLKICYNYSHNSLYLPKINT